MKDLLDSNLSHKESKPVPLTCSYILLPVYDFICSFFGFGKRFRKKVLDAVQIKNEDIILDVGCGTGLFLSVLKQEYPDVCAIGIDIDDKMLQIARRRLHRYPKLFLSIASGESLPIKENSVDYVFSTLVIHHIPDDVKRKVIYEMYCVLKQGGKLVLVDFGKTSNVWHRVLLYPIRKFEYLEGNLNGLVVNYVEEVGFKNIRISREKFLIDVIVAEK